MELPESIDYKVIHNELLEYHKLWKSNYFRVRYFKSILENYLKRYNNYQAGEQIQKNIKNGEFNWSNGDKYCGDWIGNQMHGEGIYYWENGLIYEGFFSFNQINDEGYSYFYLDEKKLRLDCNVELNKIITISDIGSITDPFDYESD